MPKSHPTPKRVLVAGYGHGSTDFCTRHITESLARCGHEVKLVQLHSTEMHQGEPVAGAQIHDLGQPVGFGRNGWEKLGQNFRFQRGLNRLINQWQPDLVVCIYLSALGMLSHKTIRQIPRLGVFFPDIPVPGTGGRLGRFWISRGWNRLRKAGIVWASDKFKAELAQQFGGLKFFPLVSHNCPRADYLAEPTWPREGWLRAELRKQGATIGETGGSILLRAGAVGECGGIEETLAAMHALPEDYIFVMMGRPPETYKRQLLQQISTLGLQRRAFLFDRPSDTVWKQVLQGADIGHLIHGPFPSGRMNRQYELNSSLSNCRLFQYMAASMPIISYDDPRMNDLYAEVPCFRIVRLARLGDDILTTWCELGAASELRQQLGRAGRRAHENKYCWEKQFSPVVASIFNHERTQSP